MNDEEMSRGRREGMKSRTWIISLRKQKGLFFFRARGMLVRTLSANRFVGEWEGLREITVDRFYSFCEKKSQVARSFSSRKSSCSMGAGWGWGEGGQGWGHLQTGLKVGSLNLGTADISNQITYCCEAVLNNTEFLAASLAFINPIPVALAPAQ